MVKLCSHEKGGRAPLTQNRFLRLRKLLLVLDWDRAVGNFCRCGNAKRMRDFLTRIRMNQENPSAHSVYLTRKNQKIVIRRDCGMDCGRWDIRLNKILFGSPWNASSSFSISFAIVFSGYFLRTLHTVSLNRGECTGWGVATFISASTYRHFASYSSRSFCFAHASLDRGDAQQIAVSELKYD